MADPELVKILRQGSEVWNRWREQQLGDMQIDLSDANLNKANLRGTALYKANLSGANLSGANLSRADLSEANLSNAYLAYNYLAYAHLSEADLSNARLSIVDLSGSDLSYADLDGANLSEANLSGAKLRGAVLREINLSEANLSGAVLRETNLSKTNLSKTNLSKTNLSRAYVHDTVFSHLDLRKVKGLTKVDHGGPSYVALHTIQLPQDGSALHFLRGCGVPDEWIDFWRSTMMNPIQYHSCFISYAHQDNDIAHRLHSDLQDHGVRCWFAPHDMKIGDKIRPRIDEAIHLQDKLLLILSEHSVSSDWVEHEVETALAKEHKEKRTILFPIRLDDAILEREHTGWPALVQHERHIGDFTGWKDHDQYQVAFKRLLRDLKQANE